MKAFTLYLENKNTERLVAVGKTDPSFLGNDRDHKKCLPFKVAGEMGWDILLPETYEVYWNGGDLPSDIKITTEKHTDFISSTLGNGILTFKIPYLFELEEETFLWIKGGGNCPLSIDLYPCEGVVEADWFPGHITMNYKFITREKQIVLKKGTPYCRLLPYPKNYIESFNLEYATVESSANFKSKYLGYNFFNQTSHFFKAYIKGMLGREKVKNIPRIILSTPKEKIGEISKCPMTKLFKR
jgi:hypothetical protein